MAAAECLGCLIPDYPWCFANGFSALSIWAEGNRSAGSIARARSTTRAKFSDTAGLIRSSGSGSAFEDGEDQFIGLTQNMGWPAGDQAVEGRAGRVDVDARGRPAATSMTCSGAMYASVPKVAPSRVIPENPAFSKLFARPKSANFAAYLVPSRPTSRLLGLMSR